MREKALDLIYLNTKRYISIKSLQIFYWAIIIPLIIVVFGLAAINTIGVNWKSLFPLISIGTWSLLYWTFVLTIQSNRAKKTFELRFLVNGISGLLISSLFWILYASLSILDNNFFIGFDFSLWILFFYLLFSTFYIYFVVFCVHKGIFKRIKEKSQTPKALAILALFFAILPSTGVMGMYASKILRAHASEAIQEIVGAISLVLVIFLPILAHINFVQYFYCKKYKIFCDEYGNTSSPNLERKIKDKSQNKNKDLNQTDISVSSPSKKKIPSVIKILLGIVCIPVVIITIIFIVFFIKGFMQGIT